MFTEPLCLKFLFKRNVDFFCLCILVKLHFFSDFRALRYVYCIVLNSRFVEYILEFKCFTTMCYAIIELGSDFGECPILNKLNLIWFGQGCRKEVIKVGNAKKKLKFFYSIGTKMDKYLFSKSSTCKIYRTTNLKILTITPLPQLPQWVKTRKKV